ncbi:MAG: hypothetical protein V4537_15125 [Pseudomonadota bacterium]
MTLRPTLAAITLFALPVTCIGGVAMARPGSDTATTGGTTTVRTTQTQRKIERPRPGTPLKPRMIEAPGAAVMMIPAGYDATQTGPFSPL